MRISGLNHLITIEKRTFEKVNGFETEKWTKYKSVWAYMNSLYGTEYYRAKELGEDNTVNFEIHYIPALDNLNTIDYRIKHNKKIYDITGIDNVRFLNQSFKIKAVWRE